MTTHYQEVTTMIPITAYYKNRALPIENGYEKRIRKYSDFGIVIHTTNGNIGSSYGSEVQYLYTAKNVSAHFLVSKEGKITQLLPIEFAAWHAGYVNDSHFTNYDSIGIEMHFTPGENSNQPKLNNATKELIRSLITQYPIYGIRMHREIAIYDDGRLGRKIDPSHMNDEEFRAWRSDIYNCVFQKTIKKGALLHTAPTIHSPIASHITDPAINIERGKLTTNTVFPIQYIANGWIWIPTGIGFFQTEDIV